MDPVVYLDSFEEGMAKALQLYLKGEPILVFGSNETKHADMLESILTNHGIPFEKQNLFGPEFGPKPKESNYELAGASWATVGEGGARLWGDSFGYGIGPNEEHAEQFRTNNPGFILEIRD